MKYKVLLGFGKWAKYINRDIESQAFFTKKALKCLPNRLTPLYSKIHYEEENYLEVKTKLFIYPSPPHSKGLGTWECWYIGILRFYVLAYLHTELCYVTQLPLIP